jgi:hypothetical protein
MLMQADAALLKTMTEPPFAKPLQAILDQDRGFGHREHLQLAWAYLDTLSPDRARTAMTQAIRHLAEAHGTPERYHETLTMAWMRMVELHRERFAGQSFDEFLTHHQPLMDSHLLERHYSRDELFSDRARRDYVEPDLRAFPSAV